MCYCYYCYYYYLYHHYYIHIRIIYIYICIYIFSPALYPSSPRHVCESGDGKQYAHPHVVIGELQSTQGETIPSHLGLWWDCGT